MNALIILMFKAKKILFILLLSGLIYILTELIIFIFLTFYFQSTLSPKQYLSKITGFDFEKRIHVECEIKDYENTFLDRFKSKTPFKTAQLSFLNSLGPHPYLGYTLWSPNLDHCRFTQKIGNNQNFNGPDFPEVKDNQFYTILLTGGSVANILTQIQTSTGKYFIEDYLNSHFISPNGKKFKVISTAMGDYRIAQSLISFMLYHDLVDALIDLSGYNESNNYYDNLKIENPSGSFWGLFDLEIENEIKQQRADIYSLSQFAYSHFWCSNSYICSSLASIKILHSIQKLENYKTQHTPRYVNHLGHFQYAQSLSPEEKTAHRIKKHQSYYRIFNSMCTELEIKCSFFLQPIPQIGKVLTPEEKINLLSEKSNRAEVYKEIVSQMLSLRQNKMDINSLEKIFQNEKGQIYRDNIHYLDSGVPMSRGYFLLWQAITEKISVSWKLKKKIKL